MPNALLREASLDELRSEDEGSEADVQVTGSAPLYTLQCSVRGFTSWVLGVTLVLLAAHTVLSLYHFRVDELPWLLRQLFDLDEENNLPTWFSQFLLLSCACLLGFQARAMRARADRWVTHWTVLAVGFFAMAIDEVAGVHETINSTIEISWAIPAAVIVGTLGLSFIPFLLGIPRSVAIGFALAGTLYLGGALGVEIFGNAMMRNDEGDTLQYAMATLTEEGLEMLGLVLFAHVLLKHMRETEGRSPRLALRLS